ncbi:39S ribosomal protein L48, mitochondrial [Engraulis encrasicolus]|uniref:39S ribosomal protein L48, mitochondrial n=1 Tax=Engraulis encrasicolus TaxID=184585 RepID=UPI002FCEC339
MNSFLSKVAYVRQIGALDHALTIFRSPEYMPRTLFGGLFVTSERHYRSMPTHGIGKYKHLLPKDGPKKRKDKHQMKAIKATTGTEYGTLNVIVSGYDMILVEHYAQYIHNLCNRFNVKVDESYALPTKTTEIMIMQDQSTKMFVDAILKTHERVVQMRQLNATFCPILLEVLLKNQPEGVQLSIKEHTEADYQARFKARPELAGLMAKMS